MHYRRHAPANAANGIRVLTMIKESCMTVNIYDIFTFIQITYIFTFSEWGFMYIISVLAENIIREHTFIVCIYSEITSVMGLGGNSRVQS